MRSLVTISKIITCLLARKTDKLKPGQDEYNLLEYKTSISTTIALTVIMVVKVLAVFNPSVGGW